MRLKLDQLTGALQKELAPVYLVSGGKAINKKDNYKTQSNQQ